MSPARKYDKDGLPVLTGLESASLTWIVLRMPFVLLWTLLTSTITRSTKPTPRLLFEESSRHVLGHASIAQLQKISGTSRAAYFKWAAAAKREPDVQTLDDGTQVFWVGPRDSAYVLVYCHGGGFVGPLSDFQCAFVAALCDAFTTSSGLTLSCAVLNYSIYPAPFPTQLTQLHALLSFLLTSYSPSKIFFAGDSAGANILTQLFAFSLHPSSGLPAPLTLAEPFAAAILISPWCTLNPTGRSVSENAKKDLLPPAPLHDWGTAYRSSSPPELLPYIDLTSAPPSFYAGVERLVERVYVTVGADEILRDDILVFSEGLKKVHKGVETDVEEGGVHAGMVFEFAAGAKRLGPAGEKMAGWLVEGIKVDWKL